MFRLLLTAWKWLETMSCWMSQLPLGCHWHSLFVSCLLWLMHCWIFGACASPHSFNVENCRQPIPTLQLMAGCSWLLSISTSQYWCCSPTQSHRQAHILPSIQSQNSGFEGFALHNSTAGQYFFYKEFSSKGLHWPLGVNEIYSKTVPTCWLISFRYWEVDVDWELECPSINWMVGIVWAARPVLQGIVYCHPELLGCSDF